MALATAPRRGWRRLASQIGANLAGARNGSNATTITAPKVVVGFDGSRSSEHALVYAAGVSRRTRGALLVAYIAAGCPSASIGLAPFSPEAAMAWRAHDVSWVQELAEELLEGTEIAWQFTTCYGDAAAGLKQLGEQHRVDLLVVGRSRFSARHLLGSVPARLTRHARCPITVVP